MVDTNKRKALMETLSKAKSATKPKRGVKPDDPSFGRPLKDAVPAIGDKVRGWTGNPFALKKTK